MKEAGSTPPVSASSILAAGAASSPGRTLALSSPQPEPTSPCPQSPQTPPLDPRGDVNGYGVPAPSAIPKLTKIAAAPISKVLATTCCSGGSPTKKFRSEHGAAALEQDSSCGVGARLV